MMAGNQVDVKVEHISGFDSQDIIGVDFILVSSTEIGVAVVVLVSLARGGSVTIAWPYTIETTAGWTAEINIFTFMMSRVNNAKYLRA